MRCLEDFKKISFLSTFILVHAIEYFIGIHMTHLACAVCTQTYSCALHMDGYIRALALGLRNMRASDLPI